MPLKRKRTAIEGLSLVEVMIVVVIIAVVMGGVTMSLRALTEANLRSGAIKVAAACRYAYQRAIIQSKTVRVVFDMQSHTLAIEEAHGQITISRADDEDRDDDGDQDQAGRDPWAIAGERVEGTFSPALNSSTWGPITDDEGNPLTRYQAQPIGSGVFVQRIFTPHEPEPREAGVGAIYFFPQGHTEHTFVQLSDGDEDVFTIEVHPLTGRAFIHGVELTPDEAAEDNPLTIEDPG